ncbi:hypothetical protein ES702_05411 [subsurface metagenome]
MLRYSAAEKVGVKKEDRSRGFGNGREASEAGSKMSSLSEDESPNCSEGLAWEIIQR